MNKSLICSVLDGTEESDRVLIHDSAAFNGRPVLKFGLCELTNRYDQVHVLLCDIRTEEWVKGLPAAVTAKLVIHNFTCGLGGVSFHHFLSQVTSADSAPLVIDSLSSALLYLHLSSPAPLPAPTLCRWLLTTRHHPILALLHSDLHDEGTLSQINSIATTSMQLNSASQSDSNHYAGTVRTVHKRLSGKVLKKIEAYSIPPNCTRMETVATHTPTTNQLPLAPTADPAANLTFDLHLSHQEKVARARVVLPYTSAQQEAGLVTPHTGSGQIFYQPDEADDFDDSDPDDDLDF